MKLVVKTVYDNIDDKWLDWYLDRLSKEEYLPGCTIIVDELKECGFAEFSSKDPEGPCVGTTSYEIVGHIALKNEGVK